MWLVRAPAHYTVARERRKLQRVGASAACWHSLAPPTVTARSSSAEPHLFASSWQAQTARWAPPGGGGVASATRVSGVDPALRMADAPAAAVPPSGAGAHADDAAAGNGGARGTASPAAASYSDNVFKRIIEGDMACHVRASTLSTLKQCTGKPCTIGALAHNDARPDRCGAGGQGPAERVDPAGRAAERAVPLVPAP